MHSFKHTKNCVRQITRSFKQMKNSVYAELRARLNKWKTVCVRRIMRLFKQMKNCVYAELRARLNKWKTVCTP
jgi:hypothetical protein